MDSPTSYLRISFGPLKGFPEALRPFEGHFLAPAGDRTRKEATLNFLFVSSPSRGPPDYPSLFSRSVEETFYVVSRMHPPFFLLQSPSARSFLRFPWRCDHVLEFSEKTRSSLEADTPPRATLPPPLPPDYGRVRFPKKYSLRPPLPHFRPRG